MPQLVTVGSVNGGCSHQTRSPRESERKRRERQHRALLATYAKYGPQTAEEAGTRAGFHIEGTALANGCYWSRLSELRTAGLLVWTKLRRASSAGGRQRVSEITAAGVQALKLPPGLPVIPRKGKARK
jgi:hypothetical protein